MDTIRRLEEIFSHFPGIGPRQARRFVYYLINKPPGAIHELTKLIEEVRASVIECRECHRYFMRDEHSMAHLRSGKPTDTICSICSNPERDRTVLIVVARDSDLESIERSGAYRGLYFVLGGTVPILDKEPERRIRLQKLLEYIVAHSDLSETIISLSATPESEYTTTIVREAISNAVEQRSLKISVLGRGISTGAELEYVDSDTIKNALQNRH